MENNYINSKTDLSTFQTAGKVNFSNSAFRNDFNTKESYKKLRSNLLFIGKNVKVISVTSTVENEGKSTIAIEIAKSFSDIGKKTLLIDADMRKSTILKNKMKTHNILGLSELLSEQAEIEQVLYNTQIPNFDVIFTGRFPPNPVELLSSQRFDDILKILRAEYDYIIIDAPPLEPVIDAAIIAPHCDGTLMVIALGVAKYDMIFQAKEQLIKSGGRLLGAVLNETSSNNRNIKKSYKNYSE